MATFSLGKHPHVELCDLLKLEGWSESGAQAIRSASAAASSLCLRIGILLFITCISFLAFKCVDLHDRVQIAADCAVDIRVNKAFDSAADVTVDDEVACLTTDKFRLFDGYAGLFDNAVAEQQDLRQHQHDKKHRDQRTAAKRCTDRDD